MLDGPGSTGRLGQLVVGDHNLAVWADQSVVTMAGPGERPTPARREPVALVPRQPDHPLGRDRELAALREALSDTRLLQIFGSPGAGKSTLLRYAAAEAAQPGAGVVFLPAAGRGVGDLLQDVFEACYDTTGYRPTHAELRRLMSGLDVRLLVDDLELAADQRAELLDGLPAATLVFTSRQRVLGPDGVAWELGGLAWEPAKELFTAALDRPLLDWEERAARELWDEAGGSPLLLQRAAASVRIDRQGVKRLPLAGELAELLPRILAGLSVAARALLSVLAIADVAVSPAVLPWLVAAEPDALADELAVRGVALRTELGYQLAPGVAAAAGEPTVPMLDWVAGRLGDCVQRLAPARVAEHVPLITGVVEATVRLGCPEIGAALARVAAPRVAVSGRLDAWQRVLGIGQTAARLGEDRPGLAYLTYEDGIRSLLAGRPADAMAGITAAITLWQKLGYTTQATLAQQAQSLAGGPAAAAGPVPAHAAHGAHARRTAHRTRAAARLGWGVKILTVGLVAAVTAAIGYAATPSADTPADPASRPAGTGAAKPAASHGPAHPVRTTTAATTAAGKRGVLPTSCPRDSFLGAFQGEDPLRTQQGLLLSCDYSKGGVALILGVAPRTESTPSTGGRHVRIAGADSAWVLPPTGPGSAGELAVNVGHKCLKFQFVGTVDNAVAAAGRVLGLG